jgi:hypothetical protein
MSKAKRAGLIRSAILAGAVGITVGASAQEQAATPTVPRVPAATTAARAPADDTAPVGQSASPNPQGVVPSPQASEQGSSQGAPCALCGVAGCSGGCAARHPGLFAIGKPTQYVPPQSGWTVMVPPLPPPPPAPGAKPNPPQPWKGLFFENDFSYLDKPDNTIHNPFDFLKRIRPLGDAVVTDFGGEFRWQGKGEDNRRLLGEQNDYNLFRERLYMNTWFYNRFRFFGEVYFADTSRQTVPPLPIDRDHGDVNNLFGELRIVENKEDKGWLSFRYGWHEELLFGNQRLVSPLDWANVRRTFDLIPHLVYRGNSWAVDLFWSRPNNVKPRALNTPNYDQQFFGSHFTYKGTPNRLYDLYYLGLISDKQDKMTLNGETGNFQVHTLGLRWQGEQDNWLWEGETAYQFGRHFDRHGDHRLRPPVRRHLFQARTLVLLRLRLRQQRQQQQLRDLQPALPARPQVFRVHGHRRPAEHHRPERQPEVLPEPPFEPVALVPRLPTRVVEGRPLQRSR